MGLKVPALWSHVLFPGNPRPSSGAVQKPPHEHNLHCSHLAGNSSGFRCSVPETRKEPKCVFILSHSVVLRELLNAERWN